ncbi:hypothetical protein CLOP_g5450 [Closterium sp. NIES-67]|nr:hypothetical protein CLOP_g5450 [Closterium sp. NIES-67]
MAGDGFSHDDLALAIALSLADSDPRVRLALEDPNRLAQRTAAERGCAENSAQERRNRRSFAAGSDPTGSSRGAAGAEGSSVAELRGGSGEAEPTWERNPQTRWAEGKGKRADAEHGAVDDVDVRREVIAIDDDDAEGEEEGWSLPLAVVPPPPDPDLLDPCPDIVALFCHYNELYFQGKLGACLVEWSSKRMTLCAGVCMFDGALCRIRLSGPLLQYRPVADLKATLLHEMIHAFIFLCRPRHSRDDHGPMFQSIMGAINTSAAPDHQRPPQGYQISIYHSFKDEVNVHRRHVWQCGRCGEEVRRAMNRPPSVADCMALRQPYTGEGGREQGGGQGGRDQGGRGQGGEGRGGEGRGEESRGERAGGERSREGAVGERERPVRGNNGRGEREGEAEAHYDVSAPAV